jgi:hypothetical protein
MPRWFFLVDLEAAAIGVVGCECEAEQTSLAAARNAARKAEKITEHCAIPNRPYPATLFDDKLHCAIGGVLHECDGRRESLSVELRLELRMSRDRCEHD